MLFVCAHHQGGWWQSINFARNATPNPAKYLSERPEMASRDEKSKKAKQKIKLTKAKHET